MAQGKVNGTVICYGGMVFGAFDFCRGQAKEFRGNFGLSP